MRRFPGLGLLGILMVFPALGFQAPTLSTNAESGSRSFQVKGIVQAIDPEARTLVVRHEAIANYMSPMTMPFRVQDAKELLGIHVGDQVAFRLQVSASESWIDHLARISAASPAENPKPLGSLPLPVEPKPAGNRRALLDFKFTDELGRAVSLNDFRGQALAITFFFTRCPIPDFCPRLSKNFSAAGAKLLALSNGPTNWHFLSFSFDPEFDSPAVLRAYAEGYHYDPAHWSFLTGPADKLAALAAECDATYERDGAFFKHNFRTLIIDAAGHLQMVFPIGGNLSDALVSEIRKAAAVAHPPALKTQTASAAPRD